MKRVSTLFLQAVLILIGIIVLALLIRFPLTEGRAENLDLFSIYSDPFILYGYASSIVFFTGLYKTYRLLGYFRQNKEFSESSVNALRDLKYCALLLSGLIMLAGLIIKFFHYKDDDPAGFLAMCLVTAFLSLITAAIAYVFEKILRKGIEIEDLKS